MNVRQAKQQTTNSPDGGAPLYWLRCPSPWGMLRLLATDRGLCRIVLPGETGIDRWLARYLAGSVAVESAAILQQAQDQLRAYFAGQRRTWDLPLDIYGSPFQKAVWCLLQDIPYGETWSYTRLAAALGRPRAARAVGQANGANPCHRVIQSDGSLGGYGGGLPLKRALLELETGH
jgi:methylated-DNA-[protein]-cysteine S-methyltransferase